MNLKIISLTLESNQRIRENSAKLRGFFASRYREYELLHQHSGEAFVYEYPLIQYKLIEGKPVIVGINEGVEVIKEIYNKFDSLSLGASKYEIFGTELRLSESEFGVTDYLVNYCFLSPWFALNQENHEKYLGLNNLEQAELLKRILAGNILSMSKSLGYEVKETLKIDTFLRPAESSFKRKPIIAFMGQFKVNFNIPEFFGIGKSVSRGFGTVKRCD